MDKTEIRIIYALLGVCIFFSMLGGCNSCAASKKATENHIAMKIFMYEEFLTREEAVLVMKAQGLRDERRSVLNINQIFLTRKRPDQRVIEIDKAIEVLDSKLDSVHKNIDRNVKSIEAENQR